MSQPHSSFDFWDRSPANAPARLEFIVETMREMSRLTDPQTVVQTYGRRMRQILPTDMTLSLSRRDLEYPKYRITRSPRLGPNMNPWTMRDRLQVYEGGLLAQLIYSDTPQILNDPLIDESDPAREYLEGHRSICAVPLFDQGVSLNMVVLMRKDAGAFRPERLPEQVWMSNLFGRSTQNLVLSTRLKEAYDNIDAELKVVADIQRSLLPSELPDIPTLDLASYYQTSRRAGGDYYDFFPLPDGQWGILIADVSGHGTPAAVMMAITHSIAHTHDGPPTPPSALLTFLNEQLSVRYAGNGNFVTAFYGIYDPPTRSMTYACAGHNPPRVKRCSTGELLCLDGSRSLPLGIMEDEAYCDVSVDLVSGDFVVFYTDGITEARSPATHELFGTERLDRVVATCPSAASALIDSVLEEVERFTRNAPPTDDRTILIARVK
jgi:sigma-B regulation protein RsbU (phosphoserine phosphatase)